MLKNLKITTVKHVPLSYALVRVVAIALATVAATACVDRAFNMEEIEVDFKDLEDIPVAE